MAKAEKKLPEGFYVQAKACSSCIYRKNCGLDIKELERQVADPRMPGMFVRHRQCHHTDAKRPACCAGFWARHKDHFPAGQLAQRLNMVVKVTIDVFKPKGERKS